uniref:Exonuclease 1 n=1 Tax=Macrostomum lignano TaxID=282301 RepID=A0A1I8FK24_9PLAT
TLQCPLQPPSKSSATARPPAIEAWSITGLTTHLFKSICRPISIRELARSTVAVDTYCTGCPAQRRGPAQSLTKRKALQLLLAEKLRTHCIDVTPSMALALMRSARKEGADTIVAPYEADEGSAHALSANAGGNGLLMDRRQIARQLCIPASADDPNSAEATGSTGMTWGQVPLDVHPVPAATIFSGVPGVGLATAAGIVKRTCLDLRGLANKLNPRRKRHQIWTLPAAFCQTTLLALQLAHGNVDFRTMEPVADFDPADIGTPNNNKIFLLLIVAKTVRRLFGLATAVAAAPPSLHRCGEPTQLTASALAPLHLSAAGVGSTERLCRLYSIADLTPSDAPPRQPAAVSSSFDSQKFRLFGEPAARSQPLLPVRPLAAASEQPKRRQSVLSRYFRSASSKSPSDSSPRPTPSTIFPRLRERCARTGKEEVSIGVHSNNAPFKSPTLSNFKASCFLVLIDPRYWTGSALVGLLRLAARAILQLTMIDKHSL